MTDFLIHPAAFSSSTVNVLVNAIVNSSATISEPLRSSGMRDPGKISQFPKGESPLTMKVGIPLHPSSTYTLFYQIPFSLPFIGRVTSLNHTLPIWPQLSKGHRTIYNFFLLRACSESPCSAQAKDPEKARVLGDSLLGCGSM